MTLKNPPNGVQKQALYRILVESIKRQIDERLILPGERLPSIAELAEQHRVSHITVRSAMAELSKMGYVLSRPRSGIYVSSETARAQKLTRRPATDRIEFWGSPQNQSLAGTVVGLIAVAPAYDPTDPNRWAYFNQLHISILRGAEQAVSEAGGTGRYISIEDWTQIGHDFPLAAETLTHAGAAALVVIDIHNHPGLAEEVMRLVARSEVPIVYVSSGETCNPSFHVYCDNRAAGMLAGRHLLRQGYRDIVFVGPLDNIWVGERSEGAAKAVAAEGAGAHFRELPLRAERLQDSPVHDDILEAKSELVAASLAQLSGWPGIIAANDDAALIIHKHMTEKGLTAGRDYGLIGFDDEPKVRSLGISSMYPAFDLLGRQAVQIAAQALRGEISTAVIKLPPALFSRESTLAVSH